MTTLQIPQRVHIHERYIKNSQSFTLAYRRVHTMKVMRIESKLIRIVFIHALTAILIECAFS